MKLLFFISILLSCTFSFAQDSTYRCSGGWVEVKRVGIGKTHTVEGKDKDKSWISAKVKRVDYEYSYTPTYQGSTQPANPKEFYKPIKVKSFYYVPVSDIVIHHYPNGPIFQIFYLDSLILRSYLQDGSPRDIYYLNKDLAIDSIYRFYENGKLKTKILGDSSQLKENLVLSLYDKPELILRAQMMEWAPDWRSMWMPNDNHHTKRSSHPKKQYYCHGNGKPHVVISWLRDSVGTNYHKEYEFFDPNGKTLENNRISTHGSWTGIKYEYYESGALEWLSERCEDQYCGKTERWNPDGTINYIEYRSKISRDSIVYYKQLKDTLLTWKPPMNFEWNQQDILQEVSHKHCSLGFNNDGSVRYSRLDGKLWESYQKYKDERMQLEHFGAKDELGFPHGPWFAVNALKDTVYEINFHHGWLHGRYRVNDSFWSDETWMRNYNMGLEVDSSIKMFKGQIREIFYFSEPGKLVKKAMFFKGHLSNVDTMHNGERFFQLRSVHSDGWNTQISRWDTTLKQIYTKRFFAADSLEMEIWEDYRGNRQEWKEYFHETGTVKIHWKYEGLQTKTEENPKPGETPKQYKVNVATRWTYDEKGNLIKKERLENDRVVE